MVNSYNNVQSPWETPADYIEMLEGVKQGVKTPQDKDVLRQLTALFELHMGNDPAYKNDNGLQSRVAVIKEAAEVGYGEISPEQGIEFVLNSLEQMVNDAKTPGDWKAVSNLLDHFKNSIQELPVEKKLFESNISSQLRLKKIERKVLPHKIKAEMGKALKKTQEVSRKVLWAFVDLAVPLPVKKQIAKMTVN